jgi:hypothetical protein
VFGHAIEELGRLGRQAMVVLTWVLILIALTLATWATITSGRAQEPAPARAQPALSNQKVSGR